MNLTALFNKNYFIENIKKSKAIIIFVSLLLPLFSILNMLMYTTESYENECLSFVELNIFNIIFMYIIPIVLSISLFNYVFKKKSADFIGSMPLSRKTIFTTNTLGGIALIALIQIVTALLMVIFSGIVSNIVVFNGMIFDAFIFFTISYAFVFVVSNLAVSFSGNMFASIASTMVILFLVPFVITASRGINQIDRYYYVGDNNIDNDGNYYYHEQYNFTAPSYFFDCAVNGVDYEYNGISIIKMIVLSVLYGVAGYYLFNRKKLEMAEESFENDKVHLFVKFLSLTPFMAIASQFDLLDDMVPLAFFMAFIAVYYFVFDVVTNKKIKIGTSVITFIAFTAVLFALFRILPNLDFISSKHFNIYDDISNIRIISTRVNYSDNNDFDLVIDDKDLIVNLLETRSNGDYYDKIYSVSANIEINTKFGKKHYINTEILPCMKEIMDKYGEQKYTFDNSEYLAIINSHKFSKDEQNAIKEQLHKDLDNITYSELFKIYSSYRNPHNAKLVKYKNHRLLRSDISYSGLNNTSRELITILNLNIVRKLNNIEYWYFITCDHLIKTLVEKNPNAPIYLDNESLTDEYGNILMEYPISTTKYISSTVDYNSYRREPRQILQDALRSIDVKVLANYIREHYTDSFDVNKPYYALNAGNPRGYFYSNDIDGFYKLLAKAYNNSEDSKDTGIILNEDI